MRHRRRVVVALALVVVAAAAYAVLFDAKGRFAPTPEPDVIVKRVGGHVSSGTDDVNDNVKKARKKLAAPKPKKTAGQRYADEMGKLQSR